MRVRELTLYLVPAFYDRLEARRKKYAASLTTGEFARELLDRILMILDQADVEEAKKERLVLSADEVPLATSREVPLPSMMKILGGKRA